MPEAGNPFASGGNPFAPPGTQAFTKPVGHDPLEVQKREQAVKEEEAAAKRLADAEAEAAAQAAKPPAPVKVVLTKEQEEHKHKVDVLGKKIQDILKKHKGLESNIGTSHEYWGLQNQLRALNAEIV